MIKAFFILLLFVIPFATINTIKAKKGSTEITLGYGALTSNEILDEFSDIIITGISQGTYSSKKIYIGPFMLGCKYSITKRLSLGGDIIYENIGSNILLNNVNVGNVRNHYLTLAAEMEFKYLKTNMVSLYGLAGLGHTFYYETFNPDNEPESHESFGSLNFQITPIGIKIGRKFGWFAEAGFGYKGVISTGVFGRF